MAQATALLLDSTYPEAFEDGGKFRLLRSCGRGMIAGEFFPPRPRADLSVSSFPHRKLTITPHFAVRNFVLRWPELKNQFGVVPSPQQRQ